ncbi:MAG: multicopper oxidase domain-containing protein [Actinobacteria bacterium]|nr:multicopper oxidase domain-containing protein [Actinomycetota bacterium]
MEPQRPSLWNALAAVAAVAALIIASIAVAKAGDDEGGGGGSSEAASPAAAAGPSETTLDATLSEFKIEPSELEAPAGHVMIKVANEGAVPHTLAGERGDPVTSELAGGESATLDLGELEPGTYKLFCDVPGHEAAGMKASLKVTEAAAAAAPSAMGDDVDYAALDKAMGDSLKKFPAETEGVGAQLLEPKVLDDGTKEFRLTAKIVDWEVEPGKTVKAWTYNGTVPAPTIKVDVGDTLKVVLKNELPMGTDIHWHGVRVPNDQDGVAPLTQELIQPGQTIGGKAVPADLTPAQEFPMVLNDAGEIGYSLNGKSFPATAPIAMKQGEWILVHYINEGLQIHPMHPHGAPQLVVARDGIPLDSPYWTDTLTVAPGERYSVLIEGRDKGAWVWHCHVLSHVESEHGVFGMATAIIVQ